MRPQQSRNDNSQEASAKEIHIARLAFIGASITTLGDGIAAAAAKMALDDLELSNNNNNNDNNNNRRSQSHIHSMRHLETIQCQMDYYIHELIKWRNSF